MTTKKQIEAAPKCLKSGCGAQAIYAKPCTDFDCPQRFLDARGSEFEELISQAHAAGVREGIEKAAKIYENHMAYIGRKSYVDSISIAQNHLVGARQEVRALIKE